jgi:hypothetical protein
MPVNELNSAIDPMADWWVNESALPGVENQASQENDWFSLLAGQM